MVAMVKGEGSTSCVFRGAFLEVEGEESEKKLEWFILITILMRFILTMEAPLQVCLQSCFLRALRLDAP